MYKLPKEKIEFDTIVSELKRVQLAKNTDYDNAFEKMLDALGAESGCGVIYSKVLRAHNLLKNGVLKCDDTAKVDEKVIDTLLDGANYFIMYAVYIHNKAIEILKQKTT